MRLFFATLMFINSLFLISNTPIKNTYDQLIQNLDSTVTFNPNFERLSKETFKYAANNQSPIKTEGYDWESGKWVKIYETSFGYDAAKNKISELGSSWDNVSNNLKPIYQYTWKFDAAGNFETEEYFTKEVTEANFTGHSKSVYSYNSDATIAQVTFYAWGQAGVWVENEKYIYTYDSNKNQTGQEFYTKNPSKSDWEKSSKFVKAFDSSKRILSEEFYKGNNGSNEWVKNVKISYAYNAGKLQTKSVESGNASDQWVETSKYAYIYSGSDLTSINETIFQDGRWIDFSKEIHTYAGGLISKIASSLWNSETSAWTPYFEKQYIHNANGTSEELYSFDYDGKKFGVKKWAKKGDTNNNPLLNETSAWVNDKWELVSKEESEYAPNSNVISNAKHNNAGGYYKMDYEYTNEERPLLNTSYIWDESLQSWNKETYKKFYFGDASTIIEHVSNNQIDISTAYEKIVIDSEHPILSVNVYSLQGKQVYNGKQSEISTSDWPKSAYIVTVVTDGGHRKSAKIIIQ